MTYRAYAGIGSRETPIEVQNMFMHFARLACDLGWTLRSGGAEGADEAFERGVSKPYRKEIYLPWGRFNNNPSRETRPSDDAIAMAEEFLGEHHWGNLSSGGRLLHARNMHQILGKHLNDPVEMVVCWTPHGNVTGGTATALKLADKYGIPIFNLGKSINEAELEAIVKG